MATDLYAITNSKSLSSFSEKELDIALQKLQDLDWDRFRFPRIKNGREIWLEAKGDWETEIDSENDYPEIYYSSPYPISFYLKENAGIVTFIYKYRFLYDISEDQESIEQFRRDLFDFITIFGGSEVCFLADNNCDKLSNLLELKALENTSYKDIKMSLLNEFGAPVTDYKKLKLDSLNYRNIKEFIFDDFADLK